jgi:hypothetical protein
VEVAPEERHEPGENENQGELVMETVRGKMRFSAPSLALGKQCGGADVTEEASCMAP